MVPPNCHRSSRAAEDEREGEERHWSFYLCIYDKKYNAGHPHSPPPTTGMVMVPRLAPCASGWDGCGWVGMLVDGVVVFANSVEPYGICKKFD